MSKRLAFSTICAAAALLAGCHRGAPEGQVAAIVNGEEVTLQELNTEIQAANVPDGADKKAAQQQALQHVIDRKLLIATARDKKIDKSPEFLSQKKRAEELLLAQAYAKQQLAAVPVPTDAQISKFMADHPTTFANRQSLQLDQIRFRPTSQAELKKLSAIQTDHTMDAVASHLTQLGIKFERGKAGLDTGQVPAELVKAINGLPPGEPFVLPNNGIITVNAVIGRTPIATDPTQGRQEAVGAWRQEQFTKLLSDQLKGLRGSAKLNYQSGFAPPADTKKPPVLAPTPAAGQ